MGIILVSFCLAPLHGSLRSKDFIVMVSTLLPYKAYSILLRFPVPLTRYLDLRAGLLTKIIPERDFEVPYVIPYHIMVQPEPRNSHNKPTMLRQPRSPTSLVLVEDPREWAPATKCESLSCGT